MNNSNVMYRLLISALMVSLCAILAAPPLCAAAPGRPSSLLVILKDGTKQTFRLSEVERIEFTETEASGHSDPTGGWRNNPQATWKFTKAADGRYFAQETGLGYASGPAYFTSTGSFRIDFKTRDGGTYSGYFEMRFSPDGRSAFGSYHQVTPTQRVDNNVSWTRID